MHSAVVVFPAPFGPRMPKISPPPREGDVVHRDGGSVGLDEMLDLND
jgi:hypothetical protein